MPRATLEHRQRTVPLGDEVAALGRAPDCAVVLEPPDISRVHALVLPNADRHMVLDYRSSNGTKLNGRFVTWAFLQDNDLITISGEEIRYRSGAAEGANEEEALLRRLKAGKLDLVTVIDPARLPAGTAGQEDERLLELLELHRLALDMAGAERFELDAIFARLLRTAQRLFGTTRALLLLARPAGGWRLEEEAGFGRAPAEAAGALLSDFLSRAAAVGWPSLDKLGMHSVMGGRDAASEPRPDLRAIGLPFFWDGRIQGLLYVDGGAEAAPLGSRAFTLFVDFLFTVAPAVRNALVARGERA